MDRCLGGDGYGLHVMPLDVYDFGMVNPTQFDLHHDSLCSTTSYEQNAIGSYFCFFTFWCQYCRVNHIVALVRNEKLEV